MQAQAIAPRTRGDGRRALILLVIGILLLVIGVVGLFSLQGKAVRFDKAYDEKGDLSPYFFAAPAEGQGYSALQNLWFFICRYRLWVMVAGIALIVVYVAMNRDLLYRVLLQWHLCYRLLFQRHQWLYPVRNPPLLPYSLREPKDHQLPSEYLWK